tara:strand:+ start:774 stop:1022 length:249 start_codon:yes stop_codon:yes gene_type:complete
MVKRLKKKYHSIPSLDLHGIKHVDVTILVENYIFKHQDACPLKIITGNSDKMKKIVINTLKLHGFNYQEGDYYNRGYIHVLN